MQQINLVSLRLAGDADKIDAVAISLAVGQVVAKMSARTADGLAVGEAAQVVPEALFITEARPSVRLALVKELLHRAASGCNKKWLAGLTIVESDLLAGLFRLHLFNPSARMLERIA